jgi:ATP-dependent helicase HrpB
VLAKLPIDDVLPSLVTAVRDRRVAVLVAPPGAGKTTRVPGALLDAGTIEGEIVVLQPRRLAARLAATRIASERGVELGREVGYEVRFDRKRSAATRISLVTEGILTRRLLSDPTLRGVGCVVIDELHERNLDGDLALALVHRLRATRPELALVAMSATLDAEPVAAFLGDAPVIRSEGRAFPLTIEHVEPDDRPLGKQVSAAVRRVAQDGLEGDILVFLPGAGEIRRCAEDVAEAAATFDLAVLPLHGDLTADEQDRAIAKQAKRKVILATNVAETSVTIDGVVCVIDSGLARIARHSPWSGLPSLQIEPVSRASCAQRGGRAGRTRPGRVVRLYTKHDHDTRRAFEVPEVARADVAGAALELYGAGLAGLRGLAWYEAPPDSAVIAAEELLGRLGAVERGQITERGRRMLRFPVHPRLGRLVVEAEARGVAREACVIAALLGGRELRLERRGPQGAARIASPSDLIDDMDALLDARNHGLRADRLRRDNLDIGTAHQADRAAKQLDRIADHHTPAPRTDDAVDAALQIAILSGFPDRVGKRRAPRSPDFVFAAGGGGTLAPSSAVIDAELIVAVDVAETGARGQASRVQIRRASAVDPSWLLDLYLERIEERDELVWNADKQRVERIVQMTYDGLAIDDSRDIEGARRAGRPAAELLAKHALASIDKLIDAEALALWRNRVTLAASVNPSVPTVADEALAAVIADACEGATSFAELRQAGLLALLDAGLGEHKRTVDRLAPTHLDLPRRRRVQIHYEADKPPWIASRMQDFFGLAKAPTVGDGKVPLVLHLLAPNQRPVQVTQDLPGFWVRHYPALRNQLARRYPRHQWPEDPTQLIRGDD